MPWLEEHGDGIRVCWRAGGKREHSEVYPNKAKALEAKRHIEETLAAQRPIRGIRLLTLDELVNRYIADRSARDRCHHDYAKEVRLTLTRLFADRGWTTTKDVTPGTAGVLSVGQHRFLKAILRFAASLDQPIDQRCLRLRAPPRKLKPKADLLTDQAILRCYARALRFNRDLMLAGHMVATYGHRPESLAKAKLGDVKDGALTLEVKSGDTIRHPLLPSTLAIIAKVVDSRPKALRRPADPLLLRPDGEGGWKDGDALACYWYHQVGERVCPTSPGIYQLKRRAISRMLAGGLDVATIASITGHRTPSVILTYARTNEARQKAALAVLAGSATQMPPK